MVPSRNIVSAIQSFYSLAMNFIVLLSLLSFSFLSTNAHAYDIGTGLTPPRHQKVIFAYSGLFAESAEFPAGSATTSFQSLEFSAPIYRTDVNAVTLNLSAEQLSFTPEQNQYSKLYDLKVGLGYTKAIDDQRLWSISGRYGSASDKPFADASVTTFGMTAFYSYPAKENNRWLLLVDYSNNRPILNNIPLPGFAYFYQPSKEFRAVFGIPFATINWQYSDKWIVEFFTIVPWILKTSLNYKITEAARIYTGIDFSQVTYYLQGRTNDDERLFYDQKTLFVGVKSPLSANITADLEVGHSFDRSLFAAENYTTSPDNPVDIGNAYYAKLGFRFFY